MKYPNIDYIVEKHSNLYRFYILNSTIFLEELKSINKTSIKSIQEDIAYFAVNKDSQNVIHIISIDKMGRLIHSYEKNKDWYTQTFYNISLKSYTVKNLNFYFDNNDNSRINLVIGARDDQYDNSYSIFHYSINKNNWSSKKITNLYINDSIFMLKSDIDKYGNIHIIYKSCLDTISTLYYRVFLSTYNKWSPVEKIASVKELGNINILCDTKGDVNLVWSYTEKKNFKINFVRKKADYSFVSNWNFSKSLPFNINSFTDPILLQSNDILKLIWKNAGRLQFIEKSYLESSWSQIKQLDSSLNKEFRPVSYIGSRYKEYEEVKVTSTYYLDDSNRLLAGLDTLDAIDIFTNSINIEMFKSKQTSLDDYLKDVDQYFRNNSVAPSDISPVEPKYQDIPISHIEPFLNKFLDLYYEMESLKIEELQLIRNFYKIQNKHTSLYEKIEDIIKEYSSIKQFKGSKK